MQTSASDKHKYTITNQQFSFAYIKAIASVARVKFEVQTFDKNGDDVVLKGDGYDGKKYPNPAVAVQVKCSKNIVESNGSIIYDLEVDDYNQLTAGFIHMNPAILVIVHVPEDIDEWVNVIPHEKTELKYCAYWTSLRGKKQSVNTNTERVFIDKSNVFNINSLKFILSKISKGEEL